MSGLCACASISHPGWNGNGAVPFDTAEFACQDSVVNIPDEAQRNAAFYDCMAEKGWTQGSAN